MDTRKYNKLESSMQRLSSRLALSHPSKKKSNEQLKTVLEKNLLPIMKEEDEVFKFLFHRIHYSGSYYENLRICDANEFDLNLELKSQEKKEKFLQVCSMSSVPGYVQIRNLSSGPIEKWVDENKYVLQRKVYYWLQSVVDKALRKITDAPWLKIRRKTSGPAVTLYVEYNAGEIFSVDLVPVFVFGKSEWPDTPVRQPIILNHSYAEEWSVVPKTPHNCFSIDQTGTFWRMSFYNQEKKILNDKNHLKISLKLMKLLRDKEGWHCLSSYYLKTVSLWVQKENDVQYWNNGIGVLFIKMLQALKDYMKVKNSIPFFWDERLNLLSAVHDAEIQKIGNRIEYILKYIDNNLEGNVNCVEYFFREDTSSATPYTELSIVQQQLSDNIVPEDAPSAPSSVSRQQQSLSLSALVLSIGALALGAYLYKRKKFNTN